MAASRQVEEPKRQPESYPSNADAESDRGLDSSYVPAEESFESAAPVSIEQWRGSADSDSDGDEGADPSASATRKPALNDAVASLPESNRRHIEELFRGRFTTVRRLDRRKLH